MLVTKNNFNKNKATKINKNAISTLVTIVKTNDSTCGHEPIAPNVSTCKTNFNQNV